jgi:hypothetical protein
MSRTPIPTDGDARSAAAAVEILRLRREVKHLRDALRTILAINDDDQTLAIAREAIATEVE